MSDSRGLGRGLGALLGAQPTVSPSRGGGTLPIALMQPSDFQPRRQIHQQPLEELAASIKESGVIQPIVVRRLPLATPEGVRYEIIAGERRWRAAKLAGLRDIPTIVRELSDKEATAVALIENIQREELTAAEEARAFKRLIHEFSLTHERLAVVVGRSRAAITNSLRLLDLPELVLALIDSKKISMGHARALLGLEGDSDRGRLGQLVAEQELSVRETESLVRKAVKGDAEAQPAKKPDLSVISDVLKTKSAHVQLHQRASGGGRIIIEFATARARDDLLGLIKSFEES
jgi:ParB family transcriptional regulator, chromosome partitioning protein